MKRTPASVGGRDIVLHHSLRERYPFYTECKNAKSLNVPAWIRQAEEGVAKEGSGDVPIVVFKLAGNSKKYVIVPFDHFLERVCNVQS